MDRTDEFLELVEAVCRRPGMYFGKASFQMVCAYFNGFAAGSTDCPLSEEGWSAFNTFVCCTYRCPEKLYWASLLAGCFALILV
jgi:hypothetical protein